MAEGCDVQELVKDISCHIEGQGQTQVDVDEILRTLPLCEHPFKVPDGFDSRGQTYPLYSVARSECNVLACCRIEIQLFWIGFLLEVKLLVMVTMILVGLLLSL